MNESHIDSGRKNQKLKTRDRILEAANSLVKSGKNITLEDVAKEADISRATIYRYYSNIDSLSTELVLHLNVPSQEVLLKESDGLGIKDGILEVQKNFLDFIFKNEKASRKFLGAILSTSDSKLVRGQNRINALKGLFKQHNKSIDPQTESKLIHLAVLLMGVESVITTKDVCNLNNRQALETLTWGLEMILKGCEI